MSKLDSFLVALGVLATLLLGPECGGLARATSMRGDTAATPRCEMDERVDVMALVYNDREPEKSFAMITAGRGGGRMVGVGSRVLGRTVIAVLPQALWLGPSDDMCWMPLSHDGVQRAGKARKKKTKGKRGKKRRKGKRR